MVNANGEFKGSTKQHLSDIDERLDRIEHKLDRVIERNTVIAAGTSLVTAVITSVAVALGVSK